MNLVATIAALTFNGADGVFRKTASPKWSAAEFLLWWFLAAFRTFLGICEDIYAVGRKLASFSRNLSKCDKQNQKQTEIELNEMNSLELAELNILENL